MTRTSARHSSIQSRRRAGLGIIGIGVALSLLGCPKRANEVRAVEVPEGDGVAFEIDAVAAGLRERRTMILLDFTVLRLDCEEDCTMWFLVGESDATAGRLANHVISYGTAPSGMIARTAAKPLRTGSYTIGGTLQRQDSSGRLEKSILLVGTFVIEPGESGRNRVHSGRE
jgi:hypothetical protein